MLFVSLPTPCLSQNVSDPSSKLLTQTTMLQCQGQQMQAVKDWLLWCTWLIQIQAQDFISFLSNISRLTLISSLWNSMLCNKSQQTFSAWFFHCRPERIRAVLWTLLSFSRGAVACVSLLRWSVHLCKKHIT